MSKTLDQAIFSLPPNQLSQILEDERGFHIVRVLEREEAGRTPFTEAQVKIKEELRNKRVKQEIADHLERLREATPIWTIFDGEPEEEDEAGG